MRERALWRIPVGLLCGITLLFWQALILFLSFLNWCYMLFWNRKSKAIAEFANDWIMCSTKFKQYMYFVSEIKPFPFTALDRAQGSVGIDLYLEEENKHE